jgi:hypothetical protein
MTTDDTAARAAGDGETMTDQITKPRTWDVPAQPERVDHVTGADGRLWRKTDCPGWTADTNRWAEVNPKAGDEPQTLSWRGLVAFEGPLTQAVPTLVVDRFAMDRAPA